MNHQVDATTKHDVKAVAATLPLDTNWTEHQGLLSMLVMEAVAEPISGEDALKLLITKVERLLPLQVRDCGIDEIRVAHGIMHLELGT